jgi:hypothetical protein
MIPKPILLVFIFSPLVLYAADIHKVTSKEWDPVYLCGEMFSDSLYAPRTCGFTVLYTGGTSVTIQQGLPHVKTDDVCGK